MAMDFNLATFLSNLSEEDKDRIQSQSYQHPNGFVKIVLKRNPDGSMYRLHYWLNELAMDQNYHNHGWNFTSKILHGSLKNINYMSRQNADGAFFKYTMDLTKHNGVTNIFKSDAKFDLLEESTQIYNAGDIYDFDSRVIHKGIPLEENTITFVHQWPLSRTECQIYAPSDLPSGQRYDPISREKLDAILRLIQT